MHMVEIIRMENISTIEYISVVARYKNIQGQATSKERARHCVSTGSLSPELIVCVIE